MNVRTGGTRRGWVEDGVGIIPLTKGAVALVDAAMVDDLSRWNWCVYQGHYTTYARRRRRTNEPAGSKLVLMHRVITGAPEGAVVDHVDGNGLNNRRVNLRVGTARENLYNVRRQKEPSSKYVGVALDRKTSRWQAYINEGGKKRFLGRFGSEVEAARAYNAALGKEVNSVETCTKA